MSLCSDAKDTYILLVIVKVTSNTVEILWVSELKSWLEISSKTNVANPFSLSISRITVFMWLMPTKIYPKTTFLMFIITSFVTALCLAISQMAVRNTYTAVYPIEAYRKKLVRITKKFY